MPFREIITNLNDHGEPTGGFLIPSDVPLEDIKIMFQLGEIEIICPNEADLGFVPGTEVGDEKAKA